MRAFLLASLLLAACAGNRERPDPTPAGNGAARAELDASRTEVEAIHAAARAATAALQSDAPRWEKARSDVSTPFDRDHVERALAEHARRHGLELSQFLLAPMTVARIDHPAEVHPAAPYPVRPQDTLLEAPLRFALTPLRPERITAFLRTLPEVSPLVIVEAVERGMDFVEVYAAGTTFRALDPAPRYALEMPSRAEVRARNAQPAGDEADFEAEYLALGQEVAATNEALAALSEARLRHVRLQAWGAAREKAARHAAAIELPPPASVNAPAPRTTVP